VSHGYRAIQWNRHKLVYDAVLLAGGVLYLAVFLAWPPGTRPVTWEIREIRAAGSLAFVMLVVILSIGPLARLDRRLLPLLYNRRHFGVLACLAALAHLLLVLGWYHGQGKLMPLVSLLSSSAHWTSLAGFPFEIPGLLALLILLLMAATSHDFWLGFLTPPVWKALHMAVYAAFALIVAHVALGTLQSERSPLVLSLVLGAAGWVSLLHGLAARAELAGEEPGAWIDVGPPGTIPDGRARIVAPVGGERIAVFRHGDRLSAIANVCAHQNGPLGEGCIVDGYVTCPWHGHQFRPEDGCSPPPFTDRVSTYRLRREGGRILVETTALPPGTRVEPLLLEAE
jgi:nitrite reductase/ring-hydroxylating ferredoxin subunit/DMSO/TMAO reductase YedYZ heme-binding membrane subunit